MAELRPFPPSPRRRALARAAGLSAASPVLVGGLACGALLIVLGMIGSSIAARLGAWVVAATRGEAFDVPAAVLELAAPLLAAAALVALLAQIAQTRAVWLPRRRIAGAPAIEGTRVRDAGMQLVAAAVIGVVTFGWLWFAAPALGDARAIAAAAATLAIAWVAIGVGDALLRHRDLAAALHMTAREKREDERLASGDPRLRRYRARQQREGATLVLVGDGIAAAISWDPVRRPVPACIATGRGPRATQLVALARRDRTPIHRDPALATLPLGIVAERHWPRLAEIVAAVKR